VGSVDGADATFFPQPFGLPPNCDQEGMIVTQSVTILADESNRLAFFVPEAPLWLPSAAGSVGAVAHHNYGFDADVLEAGLGIEAGNLSGGKDTWFTEICCYIAQDSGDSGNPTTQLVYGQGYDPTIIGALQLGQILYQSFTEVLDVHFDWWTALSSAIGCSPVVDSTCISATNSNGFNDGLIYYDPNASSNSNHNLYTVKRFFLLKHFTTVVRAGVVHHAVSDLPSGVEGLAFRSSDGKSTSLILMNMASDAQAIDLSSAGTFTTGHQTTSDADWDSISASSDSISLPGFSITSLS